MNFTKLWHKNIYSFGSRIFSNINKTTFKRKYSLHHDHKLQVIRIRNTKYSSYDSCEFMPATLLAFSLFSYFEKDKETPEDKLVMTIKRSILSMQKGELDKAEKMLHLALRMAQDLKNENGITYVYDVMANLALDQHQFAKAEKLFTEVMRRLLSFGYKENDLKILHISSKIAHMSQLDGKLEKAMQGFEWTIKRLEENLQSLKDDRDVQELLGLTKNWYGQLLMNMNKFEEAKKCFQEAFDIFVLYYGQLNEEAVTLLNNLCVVCMKLNDVTGAKQYLDRAIKIANGLPEITSLGILKANLGLLYIKQGLLEQAKEACSNAWKWGKHNNSPDTVQQAEYCLEKLKKLL